jgi:molybdopterin biosynthesis enzyme
MSADMTRAPLPKNRDSIDQDQFLTILSREDALARFEAALFPRAILSEQRRLSGALGCALAEDIVAPIDVPPFDRANVDGFAIRSADLAMAGEGTTVRLMLNDEVIACGTAPTRPVLSGTATSIATGGPVPRGADAIVMVEHTQPVGSRAIEIRRAASPGQFVSYAGSDIARGEALLRAGTVIGSREIGMLAACGIADVVVARRPRVAVISTGDELVQPRSTTPMARSSPPPSTRTAARPNSSAPFPMTRINSKSRCAKHLRPATCWYCPAAPPRAPAMYPIASSRGSASPASSRMASR